MIPIIDTHQHLWDLSIFRLPWLAGGGPLAEDHVMSRYLEEAAVLNLAATIYMEVDVDPTQHVAEAEYVIDLCRRHDNPMRAATIGGRPAEPGFAAYIERFAFDSCVRGVRQVLHGGVGADMFLSEPFVAGIRELARHDLHFDLCLKPTDLEFGAELVDRCPGVRFVLDHCGNGEVASTDRSAWMRGIREMARREQVICKISGIVAGAASPDWTASDLEPIITYCAEAFGAQRLVFGSDWPVCTLRSSYLRWVEALQSIVAAWSPHEQQLLFHDNALRFYGLSL